MSLITAPLLLAPRVESQGVPSSGPGSSAQQGAQEKSSARVPALKHALDALSGKVDEMGGSVTASIVDVETGDVLASKHAKRALNPASNAKVLTAAAALSRMKGSYRYVTALYGKVKGGSASNVVLRGSGDPSLTTGDLWELVHELKQSGVKRIEGDLLVDQRFFDEQFTPPAFEQQPNEWAPFRAPTSALAVNGNTVTLVVRPSAAGSAAQVSFDPPGFVDVEGQVKTVDGGAAQNVVLTLSGKGNRLSALLAGSVPESSRALSFTRRVEDPRLLAGYVVRSLFAEAQITFSGEVKLGGDRSKAPAIATHRSKPLSTLLYELGKQSDNFYAEMVFKSLALEEKGRPAKAGGSVEVVTQYLAEVGATDEGTIVKNGSGLFDANRVSAGVMTKLLRAALRDGTMSSEFVAQFAIGGQDGTLRHRFRELSAKGVVRAKTGTLEGAAALSGYVMAPPGKSPIAFSILVNGVPGKVSNARVAIDKAVTAIVAHLWGESAAK